MKKIMFNDKYGLTQAVLEGRKTMTRRIIHDDVVKRCSDPWDLIGNCSRYHLDEIVAVAQAYKEIVVKRCFPKNSFSDVFLPNTAGWNNKMFVRADLMPYRIRITDIKAERLQDISDEDAMREGVFKYEKPPLHHEMDMFAPWPPYIRPYKWDYDNFVYRCNARAAFAVLIDRISGKGTWGRNHWVFAYSFELIK